MTWTIVTAAATGIAIAAACGLRAFLPLLTLGAAARAGFIALDPSVAWLAHDPVLIALAVAAAAEIAGDKVPVVDHALDAISTVVRPLAGGLAAYAAVAHWPEPIPLGIALIAGTGALGVHALKAKTRVGSTLFTAGAANPVLSLAEDFGAFGLTAVAIVLPLIALALTVAAVFAVRGLARAVRRVTGGSR